MRFFPVLNALGWLEFKITLPPSFLDFLLRIKYRLTQGQYRVTQGVNVTLMWHTVPKVVQWQSSPHCQQPAQNNTSVNRKHWFWVSVGLVHQLLCSSLATLGDPDPTDPNSFLCLLQQGFQFVFPLKSIWSQKGKCIPGYKWWCLSKQALSPLQVRVNQSSPQDVIIYAGDIYLRWLGIIIYQKVTFSPNLHHVNRSSAKHKDPDSDFSSMSYQLPNINPKSVAMASSIDWFICVQIFWFKERAFLDIN